MLYQSINTLKDKLRILLPYLVIIISCLLANSVYLQYVLKSQKEKEKLELRACLQKVGTVLVNDFKNALQGNRGGFLFFYLFSNLKDLQPEGSYIALDDKNIYVITPKKVMTFKKESFVKFINDALPPYVNYQVLLNRITIVQKQPLQQIVALEKKYPINKDYKVTVRMEIDKKHLSYLSIQRNLYIKLSLILVLSLIITLGLLYLYLRQRFNLEIQIKYLKSNLKKTKELAENRLSILNQYKNAFRFQRKTEQRLRKMFIKTATAIYLDHNIPNINNNQKRTNDELSGFLFPITFTEPANNQEIEVDQVIKDLTGYLAYDATKYDIKFDKQVDTIKVQCSETAFYQILFSLVSNLILLMPQVSDSPPLLGEHKKKFTITFQEEKIIIDFETFPLNSEQIASFAGKKMPVDAFFLDYKRVLESLKAHNIDYSVSSYEGGNLYELDFKNKRPNGKPHLKVVE